MERRIYGRTGEKLSILGFGGLVAAQVEQREANNFVAEAIDSGINYFDVAPTYFDAEDRLGPALEGKRNKIFLACKTEDRTKDGAEKLLKQSLKKLKTNHFDLYQLHAMSTLEDVEKVFGPNGAMETFLKARKEGLIRFIGFSAHSEEAACALIKKFEFDSVLFPINWVSKMNAGFGTEVIDNAQKKNMGIMAIKSMAKTSWAEGAEHKYPKAWYEPIDEKELACLALKYTLSQPITAAVPPGDIEHLKWAIETAKEFRPITENEENLLRLHAKDILPLFPIKG